MSNDENRRPSVRWSPIFADAASNIRNEFDKGHVCGPDAVTAVERPRQMDFGQCSPIPESALPLWNRNRI